MRSFIKIRHVLIDYIIWPRLSFEKRHMLCNGVFGCHANTCYVFRVWGPFGLSPYCFRDWIPDEISLATCIAWETMLNIGFISLWVAFAG